MSCKYARYGYHGSTERYAAYVVPRDLYSGFVRPRSTRISLSACAKPTNTSRPLAIYGLRLQYLRKRYGIERYTTCILLLIHGYPFLSYYSSSSSASYSSFFTLAVASTASFNHDIHYISVLYSLTHIHTHTHTRAVKIWAI